MTELVLELEEFSKSGKALISLKEGIDLSTAAGRMMTGILAVMANFERDRISERTRLGLARVKAQGKKLGRPFKIHIENIKKQRLAGLSYRNIAISEGVSKTAIIKRLQNEKARDEEEFKSAEGRD